MARLCNNLIHIFGMIFWERTENERRRKCSIRPGGRSSKLKWSKGRSQKADDHAHRVCSGAILNICLMCRKKLTGLKSKSEWIETLTEKTNSLYKNKIFWNHLSWIEIQYLMRKFLVPGTMKEICYLGNTEEKKHLVKNTLCYKIRGN